VRNFQCAPFAALLTTNRIRITFSIADLNALDPNYDQDRAMSDEEDEGIDSSSKVSPEEQAEEDGEAEEQDPSFPARLSIIIEKANKGALAVESVVQDGMVVIDNVYYYTDASHAHAKTAEKVHERQDLYVGPPFSNLDEDLQVLLERYLEERGINTALAVFVPDYIDMKEQKEYLRWLENVKGFVEA
jgi:complement component 1 Q subcomponent-binding protein